MSSCQEVHPQLRSASLWLCHSFHLNPADKDSGSVDKLLHTPCQRRNSSQNDGPDELPAAVCLLCASVSQNTEENATNFAFLFSWWAGRICQDRGADPLNSGAQKLEKRDSIPVWSANLCSASQPGPWEAKSPVQRHCFGGIFNI